MIWGYPHFRKPPSWMLFVDKWSDWSATKTATSPTSGNGLMFIELFCWDLLVDIQKERHLTSVFCTKSMDPGTNSDAQRIRNWNSSKPCNFKSTITYRIHVCYDHGNIYHQYTPNVSIYTIHGSYGLWFGNLKCHCHSGNITFPSHLAPAIMSVRRSAHLLLGHHAWRERTPKVGGFLTFFSRCAWVFFPILIACFDFVHP